jgi:hypothetical protein
MALSAARQTSSLIGNSHSYPQKGSTTIYQGALVMMDTSGYARPGAATAGCFGVGRARSNGGLGSWANTGSDGDETVDVDEGVFGFDNSASADEITSAHVGAVAYIVDDETVALTSNSGARPPAGIIRRVEGGQVYVEMSAEIGRRIFGSGGVFVSSEQTGTGANQNVAHTLGVIPRHALAIPTDLTPATVGQYVAVAGTHTTSNIVFNVTLNKKYVVVAFA